VVDHGFIQSLYAFDPNNIPIEFSWAVPGVDLRARPKMVDRAPSAAALEGPEPRPEHRPAPRRSTPPEDRVAYPGEGRALADPEVEPTW
jgi:hypothetical protein